jgi:hypothetical protein
MSLFTVEEFVVPAPITATDAVDFIECIELSNAVESLGYGTTELESTLPFWLDVDHSPRRQFGVRIDGRMIGRGFYEKGTSPA